MSLTEGLIILVLLLSVSNILFSFKIGVSKGEARMRRRMIERYEPPSASSIQRSMPREQ